MADSTPEEVAYRLLESIASNEGVTINDSMGVKSTATRQWILDTYAECLHAVKGKRKFNDQVRLTSAY